MDVIAQILALAICASISAVFVFGACWLCKKILIDIWPAK